MSPLSALFALAARQPRICAMTIPKSPMSINVMALHKAAVSDTARCPGRGVLVTPPLSPTPWSPRINHRSGFGLIPAQKFTVFALLPAEVRYMIWEIDAMRPKVIELVFDRDTETGCWRIFAHGDSLLQVCRESRHLALRSNFHVLNLLDDATMRRLDPMTATPKLPVNFDRDFFFLSGVLSTTFSPLPDTGCQLGYRNRFSGLSEMRKLIVDQTELTNAGRHPSYPTVRCNTAKKRTNFWKSFGAAEEVWVVHGDMPGAFDVPCELIFEVAATEIHDSRKVYRDGGRRRLAAVHDTWGEMGHRGLTRIAMLRADAPARGTFLGLEVIRFSSVSASEGDATTEDA